MKNKHEAEYIRISEEADELYSSGKKEEAGKLLTQGLQLAEKNKDLAFIEFFKGELEFIDDNFRASLKHHQKANTLEPDNAFLLSNLGVAYSLNNKEEEAIECHDKALKIKPDDYNSLRQKGVSLSNIGRYEEAIEFLDKVSKIKPIDYNIFMRIGFSYFHLKKYSDALKWIDKALKINPKNRDSLIIKGVSLNMLEKYIEAIDISNKALIDKPDDKYILNIKGISLMNLKRFDEAIEYFNKVLKLEPNYYEVLKLKAQVLEYIGKPKEAKRIIFSLNDKIDKINDKEVEEWVKFKAAYYKPKNKKQKEIAVKGSEVLNKLISAFSPTRESLFKSMEKIENDFRDFTDTKRSILMDYPAFLSILRKWNSYTPILPSDKGDNKGGGYFLFHKGKGMVIDPGFNFIDNFYEEGFKVADIDAVLITHAHNDHTVDLESILTLVYKYNDAIKDEIRKKFKGELRIKAEIEKAIKEKGKKIDLYLNVGTFMKYSGWLNLKDSEEINSVMVLQPNTSYKLAGFNDIMLHTTKSKHHEVIDNKYVIGLIFEIDGYKIGFTGDTGWDHENKEKFVKQFKEHDIKLLIAHLGSIKRKEFDYVDEEKDDKKRNECFYAHHLGLLGMTNLLDELKPELTVISEFGEELREFRKDIVQGIGEVLGLKCLPGDIGLHIKLEDLSVFSFVNEEFVDHNIIKIYNDSENQTICFHKEEADHEKFNSALKKKNRMRAVPFWERKNK